MAAGAVVARGRERRVAREQAVDGARVELGPVGEHDDGAVDLGAERGEAAAEGCAGAALPLGAVHDAGVGVEWVRPGDDDDLVDPARAERREHGREELPLLDAAVARRRAGGQDDGRAT